MLWIIGGSILSLPNPSKIHFMSTTAWTRQIALTKPHLRDEMQELFKLIGLFVSRKWKLSEPAVLAQITQDLVDSQSTQTIDIDHFTKVLGIEWNAILDTARPVVSWLKHVVTLTNSSEHCYQT